MTTDSDQEDIVTGINVTPLVDIMMVLLVVFMITAKFVSDSGLQINLPKAATTEVPATASLTVSLAKTGEMLLMDQPVDLAGLKSNLAREAKINPGLRVTLEADGEQAYSNVVAILDTIKQAGVTRVALAAER